MYIKIYESIKWVKNSQPLMRELYDNVGIEYNKVLLTKWISLKFETSN